MKPNSKKSILVVGSANMDMVVTVDRFPEPGETILGGDFAMHPGGKGANQAVAAARLGAGVRFFGKMGRDVFRDRLFENMKSEGIRMEDCLTDADAPTGIALISVDSSAQNEIIVVSGSNMRITPADLDANVDAFEASAVLLLQLEIPLATAAHAAKLARIYGLTVILNPAPAQPLPDSLLSMVDFLTPNETETEILTGVDVSDLETAELAARALLKRGPDNVVVTLGDKGVLWVNGRDCRHYPGLPVQPVDTTAAGDAFNGALAYFLLNRAQVEEAIRQANAAAALAVTRSGAQASMPTSRELNEFLGTAEGEGEMVEASPEEID